MAAEILELREEVERLRRPMENVQSGGILPWPATVSERVFKAEAERTLADLRRMNGRVPQTPDPELVRLRQRVDEIEQEMLRHRQ